MPFCPTCQARFAEGQFCPTDGTQLLAEPGPSPDGDPLVGQVVAERFRVLDRLGAGGMGTVYRAEHIYIKKHVALKLLRPEITANPEAITRFQREALSASTIGHDNIVRIDDFGRLPDGQVYLTMEFLDGCPLAELLKSSTLTMVQLLDIALQTCHGLAAAHSKGIVHRDMKPENIFICRADGAVKILDFGIAKVIRTDENTNLTKTGAVFGTPNYMAPEQALGRRVDHRADIYSLGVILYEMLTQQLPFKSDSFIAILAQHVTEPPVPPRRAAPHREIPLEMEAIILRAMAKEADRRFQDMREMIEALLRVRQGFAESPALPANLHLSRAPAAAVPVELPEGVATIRERPSVSQPGTPTATAGELLPPTVPAQAAPPSRGGRKLVVGLTTAVVLAGAAIAGVVVLRRPSGEDPAKGGTAPGSARPTTRPDAAPAAPTLVDVLVDTDPSGAKIELNGSKPSDDTTPAVLRIPAGQKATIRLTMPGYLPALIQLVADHAEKKMVKLTKAAAKTDHHPVVKKVPGKVRETGKRDPKRGKGKRGRGHDDGDHGSDHGGGESIEP
jgi:eukaryotic-like serine/threonine-protein kinase